LRSDPNDTDGHLAADRAASVLSVGARCARHPATGQQEGPEPPTGAGSGVGHTLSTRPGGRLSAEDDYIADTLRVGGRDQGAGNSYDNTPWTVAASLRASDGHHGHSSPRGDGQDNLITGPIRSHVRPGSNSLSGSILSTSSDSDRMREATGLAGRLDDSPRAFTKAHNVSATDGERWMTDREARAMNGFDGDRTRLVLSRPEDSDIDPEGIDSARYRVIGNGVAAPVAEWVGRRLAEAPMPE
jgi:site-specific DNA-cytosine methylase